MSKRKKIGVIDEIRVSRHGSGLYLRVPDWLVKTYLIEKGDRLRVKIQEVVKIREEVVEEHAS